MKVLVKLFSLICAVMLCFAFGACGGGDDSSSSPADSSVVAPATEYTIFVVDTQGNPLADVFVGICTYNEATGEKGSCFNPIRSDANGKVVFTQPESVYIVNEEIFEDEYVAQESCVLTAYGEYTLVLSAK